jgi:hypothetical protein
MVPTLNGRIQTRIFALAVIGGLTQLWLSSLLPGMHGRPLSDVYQVTFAILGTTIVLGIAWELLYHLLMQFRWEKDWPTLFGLVTVVNEGALLWFLVKADVVPFVSSDLPLGTFVLDFAVVWLLSWLWVNGPMRVLSLHWRFNGGRLV